MSGRDYARLHRLAPLIDAANGPDSAVGLCRATVDVLAVSGASLMVMTDGSPLPLAWSDPVSGRLEELQHSLREGPCVDAHVSGRSVSEPDLARPHRARWVAFGPAAFAAGAAALFSFPLRVGGVRIGALTLYQATAGDISEEQRADGRAVAYVAVNLVLAIQAEAPDGALGADLEMLVGYTAALHQASGMVSAQLGVPVGEALMRLRAHAFTADRPLVDAAADVVARRLRLDD